MKTLVHDRTRLQIEAILQKRGGSYILHGPRSMGKYTAAGELVRLLNCRQTDPALCENQPACDPCRQLAAGSYPDLIVVRPEGKPSITIEQVRVLTQAMALSLYYASGVRVVIIDGADLMTSDAQNAMLKLIEEPPPHTLFVLVADHVESLLPTVRSRCGEIFFPPLSNKQITSLLETVHQLKPSEAAELAAAADGAPGTAISLIGQREEAATRAELARLAASAPSLGTFERLLLARKLIDTKADIARFAHILHTNLVAKLREGQAPSQASLRQLSALELFRRQIRAKVAPRVALERLILELAQ